MKTDPEIRVTYRRTEVEYTQRGGLLCLLLLLLVPPSSFRNTSHKKDAPYGSTGAPAGWPQFSTSTVIRCARTEVPGGNYWPRPMTGFGTAVRSEATVSQG